MARKIKFALEMADGTKVRGDLAELREHFDLESAVRYFLSGKLVEWLDDRYYEDEADALEQIDKDAPDFHQKLCEALGVEYEAEDDLDVAVLERLNEKKSILRQRTDDEEIIKNADKTALTQEDLADLLDVGEDLIYLCGEEFTIPARVKNKKYVGVLGTPKVTIKANSQEDLDAKGIVFENVMLPWTNIGNSESAMPAMEQAPTVSRSNWPVPFEKLHKVVMASFAEEFVDLASREFCYNHDAENIWTLVSKQNDIVLDDTQKEIALSVVCNGEYGKDEIVYIRLTEDLSSGWAFTKDSFCASHEDGAIIIPYQFIQLDVQNKNRKYYYTLENLDTNNWWTFCQTLYNSGLYSEGFQVIMNTFSFGPFAIGKTVEALVKCLKTMKSLFKKKE